MIPEEKPDGHGGYGHNSGASLEAMRAEQRAALDDTQRVNGKTWRERKGEFLLSASRQVVTDRHTAAAAADTIKLAAAVRDEIMADRQQRTEAHYQIHRQLSAMANEFWSPVDEAMLGLKQQIDEWQAEEDTRIARQQREQQDGLAKLRAEAMGVTPAPPAPQDEPEAAPAATEGRSYLDYTAPTPAVQSIAPAMRPAHRKVIRGDLGGTITKVDTTEYEIEDITLIPPHIMQSPVVTEAILSVVKRTAKQLGIPAGIRARTGTANRVN